MKHVMILTIIAGSLAAGCDLGAAKVADLPPAPRGMLQAVTVEKGPVIDGTLKSPLWSQCPPLLLGELLSDKIGPLKTTARVLLDDKNLYVAFDCVEAETDKLVTDAIDRDDEVWRDDNVEVFIEANSEVGRVHLAVNVSGVLSDGLTKPSQQEDTYWDSAVVAKTSVTKGVGWVVTLSIPLKDLGVKAGANQTWLLNLNRTKPVDGGFLESSWSAKGTDDYHDPAGWGKLLGVNIGG